jgi:DNA-binding transcriptional ArsR family regulator
MEKMTDGALAEVADYFGALAVPLRLKLLNALRGGERSVGELAAVSGSGQANVSKHLALLAHSGLVERRTRGTSAYYRIADPATYQLCDLVCGQIGRNYAKRAELQRTFSTTISRFAGKGGLAREK